MTEGEVARVPLGVQVFLLRFCGFTLLVVTVFLAVGTVMVPGEPAAALLLALPTVFAGTVGCATASMLMELHEEASTLRGSKKVKRALAHAADESAHNLPSHEKKDVAIRAARADVRRRKGACLTNSLSILLAVAALMLLVDAIASLIMAAMAGAHLNPVLQPPGQKLSMRFLVVMSLLGVLCLFSSVVFWTAATSAHYEYHVVHELEEKINHDEAMDKVKQLRMQISAATAGALADVEMGDNEYKEDVERY